MQRFRILLSILLLLCAGCALPPANRPMQDFIGEKELKIISLLAEASEDSLIGKYVSAELSLRQALYLADEKKSRAIKILLAQVLGKEQLYDEAEDLFQELLQGTPNARNVLVPRAMYLAEKGDIEAAKEVIEKIMSLAQEEYGEERKGLENAALSQGHRNLSVLAFQYGYLEEALCESYNAVYFTPTPLESARHARIVNAIGYPEQNIELLKPFLKGPTPAAEVLAELALSYVGVEKFEDALALCRIVQSRKKLPAEITTPCLWIDIYQYFIELPEKKKKKLKDDDEEELTPEELEEQRQEKILALQELDLGVSSSRIYWPARFVEMVEEIEKERVRLEGES